VTEAGVRYLVTGATGFVGGRLTRMILARGAAVTALARPSERAQALRRLGVRVVHGDLGTGQGLAEALRGADRVIHLAAVVKARLAADYWTVNRDGTARLVRALAACPSPPRLVLCSSLAAGGPASPYGAAPVSVYGASKLAGEQAARARAGRVPTVILRPGIVYGPGEPALLPALLPMIRLGLAVKAGLGPRRYCLVYVDDLCAALLAAAGHGRTVEPGDPRTGLYPISDGAVYHWRDICRAVAMAAGRRAPLMVPLPMPAVYAAAALAELAGAAWGRVPALNRDKAREMRCADWTCVPEDAVRDLGFGATVRPAQGFAAALGAR
jgi:nucleoside-diphosphate-sugar epimerase